MITSNKYLKEIGIDEDFWLFKDARSNDNRYKPDQDGFIPAEFWNLDSTFAMYIYSHLCYFKEHCNFGHPGHLTQEKWNEILDKMIIAFKLLVEEDKITDYNSLKSKNREKKINYGLKLFAKYFRALWY